MHKDYDDLSDIPDLDQWKKKRYSAYFEYRGAKRGSQRYRNFAWWQRVMLRLIEGVDSFRLDCEKNDEQGKQFCARLGAANLATMHIEGSKEVWEGKINPQFKAEFIDRPFDVDGRLKWSILMLKSGSVTKVTVTQHGDRIGMHDVGEDDLEYFAGAVHSLNFSFYYWENVENGKMVDFQPIYAYEGDLGDIIAAYQKGQADKD